MIESLEQAKTWVTYNGPVQDSKAGKKQVTSIDNEIHSHSAYSHCEDRNRVQPPLYILTRFTLSANDPNEKSFFWTLFYLYKKEIHPLALSQLSSRKGSFRV
jgi:hypothetical protein